MSLNDTPSGERVHIGFFGCRNAGKSSLVNAVTNQQMSVVSDIKGTTTDPVKKAMELLPMGPVLVIDTPGYDDVGGLGEKRIEATKNILRKCDIAVLVTTAGSELNGVEKDLLSAFKERNIPYIVVKNKCDLVDEKIHASENIVYTDALHKKGIEEFKNKLAFLNPNKTEKHLLADLISPGDFVVLVTPIDSAAPKGRMILPQQQAIRDVIDSGAVAVVVRETELESVLKSLGKKPRLVVTDSQVFSFVNSVLPSEISLTSFSVLMARYKGFLNTAVAGAEKIKSLKNGSKVLISEGCTHHRQCEDIGTVKLPKWLKKYTGCELDFQWSSGMEFPQDLAKYDLIIHCGGCMLNEKEMQFRMNIANEHGVPFTNYGTAIAFMNGILKRTLEPLNYIEK